VIDKYVERLIAIADHHTVLSRGRVAWHGSSAELGAIARCGTAISAYDLRALKKRRPAVSFPSRKAALQGARNAARTRPQLAKFVEPDRVRARCTPIRESSGRRWSASTSACGSTVARDAGAEGGDYYTTRIGRQPMLMVRGKDGKVNVLYNRCRTGLDDVRRPERNAGEFFAARTIPGPSTTTASCAPSR